METSNRSFMLVVKTNDMPEASFMIIPFSVDDEPRFEVSVDQTRVGTLHKTFEDTWEWIDGNLTLSDAEEIGEKIEAFNNQ